jgi:hypothetical protein
MIMENIEHPTSNIQHRIGKWLILLAALFVAGTAAAQITTYTVTLTNAGGTTNGYTITVNGATRIWTNSVTTNATQIMTNNSPIGSTSNLYNAYLSYPAAGLTVSTNSGTNVVFTSYPGYSLTVTVGGNWATVSSTSTAITNATVVEVPPSIYGPIDLTNIENGLAQFFNDNHGTIPIITNAPILIAFVATNGIFFGYVSNAAGISGTVFSLTNGNYTNPIISSGSISNTAIYNGTNYGVPFRSPGYGAGSEQIGISAVASNQAIAIGNQAFAWGVGAIAIGRLANSATNDADSFGGEASAQGLFSVAIGEESLALNGGDSAFGGTAQATGGNSLALGGASQATYTNSSAIGPGAVTTTSNQMMLGVSGVAVVTPGTFTALQGFTGTNIINATLVGIRFNNTAMANGPNQDVQLGTNMATKLTGETAAFSTAGFAGGIDDRFCFVENPSVYNWTINNDSGFEATPANRVYTGTGADLVLTSNSFALVKYDASVTHWKVIFASGLPSSGGSGAFSGSFSGTLATPLTIGAATNTPSFTVVNTNWISGAIYTNQTGRPILVCGSVVLTTGSVVGYSQMALSVPGSVTNYASVLSAIGGLTGAMTNAMSPAIVTNSGTFTWTNTSSGAGDSSGTSGGQYIVY